MLQFLIVLAILVAVVMIVGTPIRRARIARTAPETPEAASTGPKAQTGLIAFSEIAELEAARDAKYREIRDAELDHRTGKLSDSDFEAVDRGLRAEAIEILSRLDRLQGAKTPETG